MWMERTSNEGWRRRNWARNLLSQYGAPSAMNTRMRDLMACTEKRASWPSGPDSSPGTASHFKEKWADLGGHSRVKFTTASASSATLTTFLSNTLPPASSRDTAVWTAPSFLFLTRADA